MSVVNYTGYYVSTSTWSATPGEPKLSVTELYEALDLVDSVYPGSVVQRQDDRATPSRA